MPEVLCRTLLGLHFSLALVIAGCGAAQVKETDPEAAAASNAIVYPDIDTEIGEHLYPSEKPLAEELSVVIEQSIRKQYAPRNGRRDAHPKAHGCVKAEVHVLEALPGALAKGIFIPGTTYQAWIRFSNGSSDPTRADIKRDARGMAMQIATLIIQ